MPAPQTGSGPFVRWLVIAAGLAVLGLALVDHGYDTESLFATGEITNVGRAGYVILAVSALVAQYAIAGLGASAALRDWHSRNPADQG